jgi:hypothetical protein
MPRRQQPAPPPRDAAKMSPRISIGPEPVLADHAPSPPAAGSHCPGREVYFLFLQEQIKDIIIIFSSPLRPMITPGGWVAGARRGAGGLWWKGLRIGVCCCLYITVTAVPNVCCCLYITAVPDTKMCAWGEEDRGEHVL